MSLTRTEVRGSRLEAIATPRARMVAGVVSFAVLTALSAKIAVPVPGTAVPFTFQTLAVVLAGTLLGARLGVASQILYLAMGFTGVPVFYGPVAGPAYLLGPTGGYLLAYPLAAYLTGRIVGSGSLLRTVAAMLVGVGTIYTGGAAWLAVQSGWAAAISLGIVPFVVADLVKVVVGVGVAARLRERCRTLFSA